MNAAMLFFGVLWALLGGKGAGAATPVPPSRPASTPPWPSVRPSGLPPFPGTGWEYDEPPPAEVQQRAGALRAQLWGKGKGAHQIEQTGGRWIVYRAEITRGNKQGVVAYRERGSPARLPPTPTEATSQRPPLMPAPVGPIAIPAATTDSPNVYLMRAGLKYRIQAEAELGELDIDAEAIKRGLELGGATNIEIVQTATGTLLRYDAQPKNNFPVIVGEWLEVPVPNTGKSLRIRFIEIKPLGARTSPIAMPTLRRGSQGPDVAALQTRLGIAADGKFGPATHAAVVAFQRQKGLTPDGIVGPQTWVMLFGKAA